MGFLGYTNRHFTQRNGWFMDDLGIDITPVATTRLSTRRVGGVTWTDRAQAFIIVVACVAALAAYRRAEREPIAPVDGWREQNDAHLAKVAARMREAVVEVHHEAGPTAQVKAANALNAARWRAEAEEERTTRERNEAIFAAVAERQEAFARANRSEARWQAWQVKEGQIYLDFKGRLEAADRHARNLSRNNAAAHRRQALVKASIDVATTFKMRPAEVLEIFDRRSNLPASYGR
jgi:hypothetical protein